MADNPRIDDLRRRVEADPASIAFAALAEELRRAGSYREAIETCRTGLQRHPSYISARVTLGRALIETGEYAAARAELETVLKAAPENLAAIRAMAEIHEREGHVADQPAAQASRQPIAVQRAVEAAPSPAGSVLEWSLPPAPPPPTPPAPGPPARVEAAPLRSPEPVASAAASDAAVQGRLQALLAAIQAARASDSAVR